MGSECKIDITTLLWVGVDSADDTPTLKFSNKGDIWKLENAHNVKKARELNISINSLSVITQCVILVKPSTIKRDGLNKKKLNKCIIGEINESNTSI